MGVWYKPQEWFRKFFRKKDLREICREKYGDDFVEMYDIYDEEEIHPNCTVQIWRNSQTGEESVGWWENE